MSSLWCPWCADQGHIVRQSFRNYMYVNFVGTRTSLSFRENFEKLNTFSILQPAEGKRNRANGGMVAGVRNGMSRWNMVMRFFYDGYDD